MLGYVPLRGEDTVLLLCRDTPAAAPGLRGLDVDLGAWAPVVLDRAFVPWLVRPPTDEERHRGKNRSRGRVSVARAAAMEAAWRKERGGEGEAREGDGKVAAEEAAAGEPPKPLELEPLRPSYEDGYAFEAALAPCVDATTTIPSDSRSDIGFIDHVPLRVLIHIYVHIYIFIYLVAIVAAP